MLTMPSSLTHERVGVFIDHCSVLHGLRRAGRQVDLVALRDYLAEGRHLIETMVYVATHPQPERHQEDQLTLDRLRQSGFLIRSKPGRLLPDGRLTCSLDLEMALDIQEFVGYARPDIIVLVTGDGDLTPLVQRLRMRGIRVEVASTLGSVSASLRAMANGFVDLAQIGQEVDNLILPPAEQVEPRVEPDMPEEAVVAVPV